jgi:hypothetical protein
MSAPDLSRAVRAAASRALDLACRWISYRRKKSHLMAQNRSDFPQGEITAHERAEVFALPVMGGAKRKSHKRASIEDEGDDEGRERFGPALTSEPHIN